MHPSRTSWLHAGRRQQKAGIVQLLVPHVRGDGLLVVDHRLVKPPRRRIAQHSGQHLHFIDTVLSRFGYGVLAAVVLFFAGRFVYKGVKARPARR